MKVVNDTPRGASVHITDLRLRLGRDGVATLSATTAARSTDLVNAVESGLVRLEFTEVERNLPSLRSLLARIEQAEAKRSGVLLAARTKKVMESSGTPSLDVPARPVVFAPIDT